ncbi:MAG: adenosylcobalamin-dependent ribonucleoside-diphosphate reductase [Nanoarchaeota archaeon]
MDEYDKERMFETYDKDLTKKFERKLDEFGLEPNLTENAISVLKKRYLMKNEKGEMIETPKQLFARVAANVAYPAFAYSNGDENIYRITAEEFYNAMINREFMPNSPTLMNAGRAFQQLAACFVLPIPDSIEGIFQSVKDTAVIQKSGGGTGFAFDKMRRKGAYISTTHGKASGTMSFAENLNQATESINQGGFRRGANMGCLDVHHPDILEFIYYKEDETKGKLRNFNISVKASDEFMKAVEEDKPYPLRWNNKPLKLEDLIMDRESVARGQFDEKELNLKLSLDNKHVLNPYRKDDSGNPNIIGEVINGEVYFYAKDLLKEIATLAHHNGEPGILFIDSINKYNQTPNLGKIESTNPCGEQPLLPYEACNLGSINLSKFVKNNKIDYDGLKRIVKTGVLFLDNVIDMNKAPISTIQEMIKKTRKIGLGIMGFADMLSQLGIKYDSKEGRKIGEEVMSYINNESKKISVELANERGVFPAFKESIYDTGKLEDRVRNAARTTIAPTGTIGFIAGASSGIEPYYSLYFIHKDADGHERIVVAMNLEKELIKENINVDEVLKEIRKGKKLSEIDIVPERIKNIFATSLEMDYKDHVLMQSIFQKHTDNAVSKTINLPNDASVEDVFNSYMLAYETGCKGITVYRDGSRNVQVLNTKKESKTNNNGFFGKDEFREPIDLPGLLPTIRIKQKSPFGNLHMNISYDPATKRPYEIFGTLGKAGEETNATLEGVCRLASLYLRDAGNIEDIISQFDGIGTKDSLASRDGQVTSIPQSFATGLKRYRILVERGLIDEIVKGKVDLEEIYNEISDELRTGKRDIKNNENSSSSIKIAKKTKTNGLSATEKCPECGGKLIFEEGCKKCSCGYSKC